MSYLRRLTLGLLAVLVLALVTALASSSWFMLEMVEPRLAPEIEKKAQILGRSLASLFGKAMEHGVALENVVGAEEVFAGVKQEHREFGVLVATDRDGAVLHSHGVLTPALSAYLREARFDGAEAAALDRYYVISVPLARAGAAPTGYLHIGSNKTYVQQVLQETLLDVLVVLVVSLFIAIEVIYFLSGSGFMARFAALLETMNRATRGDFSHRGDPNPELARFAVAVNACIDRVNAAYQELLVALRDAWRRRAQRGRVRVRAALIGLRRLRERYHFGGGVEGSGEAGKLGMLRAPLFLFLVADDLARSFIPVFAAELYTPLPGVSEKVVVGLPIMAFMLVIALLQPFAGAWSERVSRRRLLLVGAVLGVISHIGCAGAFTLYDFLGWRVVAGAAWALIFVAGQAYVLELAGPRNRVQGLAFFVGIISVASICGPSMGGILADGIGFRRVFWVAAALAALAAWLIWARIPADHRVKAGAGRQLRLADFAALVANPRFAIMLFAAAIPAKIILIAYCFYLIPLYVIDQGANTAMAGRIIMLYSLVMVFGVPLVAAWSKVPQRRVLCVGVGLLLSGLAGLLPVAWPGLWAVAATVVLLGVAQSVSIAPQGAMVGDLCRVEIARLGDGPVYGVYRLVERLGNAMGPVLGAALLAHYGYETSFAGIGALLIACAAVFTLVFLATAPRHAKAAA